MFNVPKVRDVWIKVLVLLVFFYEQCPCIRSLPCLYEQNTLRASVGESISQFLHVKVLNLQQWCTLNKMSPTFTTNASLQNAGLTFPPTFLVHMWYFDMLLCNLKWTKITLKLKFWKMTCLQHFWDRILHRDCSIYIYLCMWEKYLYRTIILTKLLWSVI
jgi:hypothetical protein